MIENLKYLSEALPVFGRALLLRNQFNVSLIGSFIYLLKACDEAISPAVFSKAREKLSSLNPKEKFSFCLHMLHSDFLAAIQEENIEKIEFIANKLGSEEYLIKGIYFIDINDLDSYYYSLTKAICKQNLPEEVEHSTLLRADFERMKATMVQGIELIKNHAPEYYEEINTLVSEILFLKATRLRHGSSIEAFGMFYRCSTFRWETLTDTIDIIIHELSHMYLFILNNDDQMVVNAEELYDSPLRVDKRPLIGIYHAAFVLARVIDVLQKSLSHGGIPPEETLYCEKLIEDHTVRFFSAMDVLDTKAQLTSLGQALIASARTLVDGSYAASCTGAVMPRAVR